MCLIITLGIQSRSNPGLGQAQFCQKRSKPLCPNVHSTDLLGPRTNMSGSFFLRCSSKPVNVKNWFFLNFLKFYYFLYSTLLHLAPLRFRCVRGCWDRTQQCSGSYVFGPPGSRSVSQRSGSFFHQANIGRKNLISTVS